MVADIKSRQTNAAFRQVLRETREASGVTQAELALRTRVARENIVRLERGQRTPTLAMVFRLCAGLQVEPAKFIKAVSDRQKASE